MIISGSVQNEGRCFDEKERWRDKLRTECKLPFYSCFLQRVTDHRKSYHTPPPYPWCEGTGKNKWLPSITEPIANLSLSDSTPVNPQLPLLLPSF
jgi:hypothetical protein